MNHCLILDIGKTNVKLHVLDDARRSVFSESKSNTVIGDAAYPHSDVDGIWEWMMDVCTRLSTSFHITAISITTHGATAALIDRNSQDGKSGLVLPVLDYEFDGINVTDDEYAKLRPDFSTTFSPDLPAGLNLGRQLYYLQEHFPAEFEKATDILMYPQYWAWRLTGKCVSEVTSLGCHTDLWDVEKQDYSSLVDGQTWRSKFPKLVPAWQNLGTLSAQAAKRAKLPSTCKVYAGLHDSNASYLRYRCYKNSEAFTVISTGTWTILMAAGVPLSTLKAENDMLANVNAMGEGVACARFMGGREFEAICAKLGGAYGDPVESSVLQGLIDQVAMALPDFSEGSGPFGGRTPKFVGELNANQGSEIATLYCALMIDYQLEALGTKGDIFIEGAFLQNPLLCSIIAQLTPSQKVYLSADATGTVQGCAYLTNWDNIPNDIKLKPAVPTQLVNLQAYKKAWRDKLTGN